MARKTRGVNAPKHFHVTSCYHLYEGESKPTLICAIPGFGEQPAMIKCDECKDGRWFDASHGASKRCQKCKGTGMIPAPKSVKVQDPRIRPYLRAMCQDLLNNRTLQASRWADSLVRLFSKEELEAAVRSAFGNTPIPKDEPTGM